MLALYYNYSYWLYFIIVTYLSVLLYSFIDDKIVQIMICITSIFGKNSYPKDVLVTLSYHQNSYEKYQYLIETIMVISTIHNLEIYFVKSADT